MARQAIQTPNAPKAVGSYSQAIRAGETIYLSGQIPLDPATSELVEDGFAEQVARVFENLQAVAKEAGGSLQHIAKLTVYLTDLADYPLLNSAMEDYFEPPFPARAVVQVAALPLGVPVEIEAVMYLDPSDPSS